MRRFLFPTLLLLATVASAEPGDQRPACRWRTVETAHVLLHFPESLAAFARPLAPRIEAIHESVSAATGYVRTAEDPKIVVLVLDPAAQSNGFALPILGSPRIVLWATAPESDSPIGRSRDWSELVALHELVHISHLTRPGRKESWFARLILPTGPVARKSPRWVSEGYATLLEGRLTGSGRPNAAYRAALLRKWGTEGKLPSYWSLDGGPQWSAPSFAYLVGSAYLEWLESREGERSKDSLVRLWKQMSGERGLPFDEAFSAVFAGSPEDLYARFVAEVTTAAILEERRLARVGVVEGTQWLRSTGSTSALGISADGTKVLSVRRTAGDAPSRIVVHSVEPSEEEEKAAEAREKDEKKRLENAEEVADRIDPSATRTSLFEYVERNRERPRDARFLPDGRRVLFVRDRVDPFGVRHGDLAIWDTGSGTVRELTRFADLARPDPSPDHPFALAVRNRNGGSELVSVDLETGNVALVPLGLSGRDPRRQDGSLPLDAPRLAPDGHRFVVLRQRNGKWGLLIGDLARGRSVHAIDLAGAEAAGPPAWSKGGDHLFAPLERDGNWGIESIPIAELEAGRAEPHRITRSLSALSAPAPLPDGSLLFLQLASKGEQIRKLPAPAQDAADLAPIGSEPRAGAPVWPIPPPEPPTFPAARDVAEREYSPLRESHWRYGAGANFSVSGFRGEPMATTGDPVGVFDATFAAGIGKRGRGTGTSAALGFHGLSAFDLRVRAYALRERPSERSRKPALGRDGDRFGAELFLSRDRGLDSGSTRLFAAALAERFDPDPGSPTNRWIGGGGGTLALQHRIGDTAFAGGVAASGFETASDGKRTSLLRGRGSFTATFGDVDLSISADAIRAGDRGLATAGGFSGSLEPELEDEVRIANPALVPGELSGRTVRSLRAAIGGGGFELFAEELRSDEPDARLRLAGLSASLELEDPPIEVGGRVRLTLGGAAIEDESGHRTGAGWFALSIRP